eukprot:1196354-Prorocentrum_minimum.AAC.2
MGFHSRRAVQTPLDPLRTPSGPPLDPIRTPSGPREGFTPKTSAYSRARLASECASSRETSPGQKLGADGGGVLHEELEVRLVLRDALQLLNHKGGAVPHLQEGVRRGSGGGQEGIYRSSLDTRKPQNPTKSEEYQGHLQGFPDQEGFRRGSGGLITKEVRCFSPARTAAPPPAPPTAPPAPSPRPLAPPNGDTFPPPPPPSAAAAATPPSPPPASAPAQHSPPPAGRWRRSARTPRESAAPGSPWSPP